MQTPGHASHSGSNSGGGSGSGNGNGSGSGGGNGGSDERQRRSSWAGQSLPKNGGPPSAQPLPTAASRRLNLSKINNRLSKLRDFN